MGRKSKDPTIYDVARHAGVSITTVSRILNASDKVNSETQKRVLASIAALGFVPKAEARAQAMQKNGRIGGITPFFTAPAFIQRHQQQRSKPLGQRVGSFEPGPVPGELHLL